MSAYCFGKVKTKEISSVKEALERLAAASGVALEFGLDESDDLEVLETPSGLKGQGVVYSLVTPGESDAVELCDEATSAGRKTIKDTMGELDLPYSWEKARDFQWKEEVLLSVGGSRLGRFIRGLFQLTDTEYTGLAIFDNGVEQFIEDSPENCEELLLRSLLIGWDLGPSALFIWSG